MASKAFKPQLRLPSVALIESPAQPDFDRGISFDVSTNASGLKPIRGGFLRLQPSADHCPSAVEKCLGSRPFSETSGQSPALSYSLTMVTLIESPYFLQFCKGKVYSLSWMRTMTTSFRHLDRQGIASCRHGGIYSPADHLGMLGKIY